MSTASTPRRILGTRSSRLPMAAVQEWTPPSQAEVAAMPPPAAYPSDPWDEARAALEKDRRERQARAEAERTAGARQDSARPGQQEAPRSPEEVPASVPGVAPVLSPAEEAHARTVRVTRARMGLPGAEEEAGTSALPRKRVLPEGLEEGSPRALIWERVEDAAKLVRTMLVEEEGKAEQGPVMQRVGILFVALGQETSGEVMKYLSDYEIEEITQAVTNLRNVKKEMQDRVLEEFEQHLLAGAWVSQGGMDFARGALERACGPRKAQEVLDRVMSAVSSGFYMLKNVAPAQIVPFISHEHPQTIALILSQLGSAQAAGIMAQLPERLQADVAYRIATMENIPPAVIKQVEESLEQSLRDILGGNQDVGGPKVVADILNLSGPSVEKNVLDQMDVADPEVSESVKNLMFTFSDIVRLTDREIQILLGEVDQKDLVIALKAAEEELKTKILGNMSEQARISITQEMEFLGPMRLTGVEEVQLRIVQQVRQLEEKGQITIVRGDSEDTFV